MSGVDQRVIGLCQPKLPWASLKSIVAVKNPFRRFNSAREVIRLVAQMDVR
jgi:hypothetical protein